MPRRTVIGLLVLVVLYSALGIFSPQGEIFRWTRHGLQVLICAGVVMAGFQVVSGRARAIDQARDEAGSTLVGSAWSRRKLKRERGDEGVGAAVPGIGRDG